MERTYESARALAGRAAGPLSSHLGAFVTSLIEQQYAAAVIHIKARHGLAFDRWLAKRRVELIALGEAHIQRYQNRTRRRHGPIRPGTREQERREVSHLLCFLRAQGVCSPALVETTAAEQLAARFEQHLQHQQGLATGTIERYRTVARQFLEDRFGRGAVDLGALRVADTVAFVKRQSQHLHPPALKCVVNALRSFLRYAQYLGDVPAALVAAVPRVATWSTTPALPKAIHRTCPACTRQL